MNRSIMTALLALSLLCVFTIIVDAKIQFPVEFKGGPSGATVEVDGQSGTLDENGYWWSPPLDWNPVNEDGTPRVQTFTVTKEGYVTATGELGWPVQGPQSYTLWMKETCLYTATNHYGNDSGPYPADGDGDGVNAECDCDDSDPKNTGRKDKDACPAKAIPSPEAAGDDDCTDYVACSDRVSAAYDECISGGGSGCIDQHVAGMRACAAQEEGCAGTVYLPEEGEVRDCEAEGNACMQKARDMYTPILDAIKEEFYKTNPSWSYEFSYEPRWKETSKAGNDAEEACRAQYSACQKAVAEATPTIGATPTTEPSTATTPVPSASPTVEATPEPSPEDTPTPTPHPYLTEDCSIREDAFDEDWRLFADLDPEERVPMTSRSWEAQKYFAAYDAMMEAETERFLLLGDMEMDRKARLEMREYRRNLVGNLTANLVKSFFRLAYITFDTIQGTKGLGSGAVGIGKSYAKLFTSANRIEKLGAGIEVLTKLTPKDSAYAINTKNVKGKVAAVGLAGGLEALEAMGDPKTLGRKVFKAVMQRGTKTFLAPSAKLTPEEIAILRDQHLRKRGLDDALQESYRRNFQRRDRAEELAAESDRLLEDMKRWEKKEKEQVAERFRANCKERRAED